MPWSLYPSIVPNGFSAVLNQNDPQLIGIGAGDTCTHCAVAGMISDFTPLDPILVVQYLWHLHPSEPVDPNDLFEEIRAAKQLEPPNEHQEVHNRLLSCEFEEINRNDVANSLSANRFVVGIIEIDDDFLAGPNVSDDAFYTSLVPLIRSHSVELVHFEDQLEGITFWCKNSYGGAWGRTGFFVIPEDALRFGVFEIFDF